MTARPPLPDVPACWTWELPPLPQENCTTAITRWQADRCAICAHYAPQRNGLYEDHCHRYSWVRGYLCPRCNTLEGQSSALVFERYRERYPALMLGVVRRRGRSSDPELDQAERDLWRAACDVAYLMHPERVEKDRQYAALMRSVGHDWPNPVLPEWTPLMRAVHRVGLTPAEMQLIAEKHRLARVGIQWRPYDDELDNPMRRREPAAQHEDPKVRAAVLASLTDDERRQLLASAGSGAS